MEKFNQAKYIQEYQKQNYDRLVIAIPKGTKEDITNHYKAQGYKSLNQYIKHLISEDMKLTEETTMGGGQ